VKGLKISTGEGVSSVAVLTRTENGTLICTPPTQTKREANSHDHVGFLPAMQEVHTTNANVQTLPGMR
jgi:hypothetical protein